MSEGWARMLAPQGIRVASAGLKPTELHPMARVVMAEVGIGNAGTPSIRQRLLARQNDIPDGQPGAVTFVQRLGGIWAMSEPFC